MWFVIGLIIGVAMSRIAKAGRAANSKNGDEAQPSSVPYDAACKHHTWRYNKEDRLQCTVCDKLPGID